MLYEKPLVIKHTTEDLTDMILRFVLDIKLKVKNIEIKTPEDFPSKSKSQYLYGIYIRYPMNYKNENKKGFTDMFPIYFDSETKFLSILDSDNEFNEVKLPNLFSVLKKAEEYILKCDSE